MKIAIASGKGGTGKTTLSVNLALTAGRMPDMKGRVYLLDCDVEEPNAHIFLKVKKLKEKPVNILVPEIMEEKCTASEGCDLCAQFCEFNALVCMGNKPVLLTDLCHGCGGCRRACPKKAIREVPQHIGSVEIFDASGITLVQGKMDIGMTLAPPLIDAVKEEAEGVGMIIMDAPPGTTCPVVATLKDSDFVILVTEPTPFGINDLDLAVQVARKMELDFGVVINRATPDNSRAKDYCKKQNIEILAQIPDDREIAKAYASGNTIVETFPHHRQIFEDLLLNVSKKVLP